MSKPDQYHVNLTRIFDDVPFARNKHSENCFMPVYFVVYLNRSRAEINKKTVTAEIDVKENERANESENWMFGIPNELLNYKGMKK